MLVLAAMSSEIPMVAAPPATRVAPVTDTLHGETLVDPYRWLEDQQAPETREWIAAQNAYTDAFLAKYPGRQALVDRAAQLMKIDSQGMPTVRGGRYFFSRRAADQDLPAICVAEGANGEPTVLIDPKSLDDGKSKTVSLMEISDDGELLLYGVRHAGEDEVTVRFFNVSKRRDIPVEMPRGRYFGVSLTPDKKTLFYTLHGKEGSRVLRRSVSLEAATPSLGEPKTLFGEGYDTGVIVSPSLSEDGAYLLLHVFYGSAAKKTDVYFQSLKEGADAPIRPLVSDIEARFLAGAVDHRAFVTTNWNAPRNRVLLVDLRKPERANWKEIIPEREGVLEDLSAVGGRLYANYLVDVKSSVTVFDAMGKELRRIAFPTLGTVSGVGGRWDGKEAFFAFSGFQTPSTIYREAVETGEQKVWSKLNVPVDTDAFESQQVFYTSKDGTRIPMFVLHRKGLKLDGNNPTMLYGYGGFNNSLTPFFSARAVLWMEQGGVYCVANLRGGGEYGEEWHQAGMQARKQNVFDDFHAAAEWLIAKKYTRPEKLAISGGSNGGLLVGAALTQRPELFRAVVCSYPLLDMVRYHKFLVARFWIPEYGSSDDPEQFRTLLAYSPYHNVKEGGKYPATLFITGDADTRVDPLHARKMAALLQAKTGSDRPVLLRYDTKLGHTGARPVSKSVEDLADEMSFLLGELCATEKPAAVSAADRLADLFTREWEYGLRESPTFASFLGDKRYNDRWPDVSLAAIERRHEHQKEVLAELAMFKAEELDASDKLNLRLFRRQLESEIEEYGHRTFLVPLTQREGIQDESSVADSLSFDTVKDYDDWTARLRAFPGYMDQTIALMRQGVAEKRLQPKITMERLPSQIRKQIVDDPTKSLYFKPYKSFSDEIKETDRTRIADEGRQAIEQHVIPAYRKFLAFFEGEYLPACFDKVGAWQFPEGQAFYAFKARQFTTTDLTPEQIHEIGLAEVTRIRKEMEQVIATTGFQGTFQEFLDHLRTDPKFYFKDPQDLLNAYLVLCKKIDPQLPKLFRKLPRTPYGIEAIPEHMAPDTTTGYYRPPAADGSRAGTYFVNLYRPEVRPTYEMEALSLHEAVPGHHLQIALANELTGVPEFRKHAGFTAYIEGWALYGERLGEDLGAYRDPYSKFGQLTYEMWRAVRLVVDTGIHSKKWTRQQAIDFFKENAAKSEHDIVNEVDRYISWPGQALAYKIGEIRIRELRAFAAESLGERFDVRDFHEVVLGQGAVPLDVLAELVMEWIARKKS
jgi:prolyl oligopeptidase